MKIIEKCTWGKWCEQEGTQTRQALWRRFPPGHVLASSSHRSRSIQAPLCRSMHWLEILVSTLCRLVFLISYSSFPYFLFFSSLASFSTPSLQTSQTIYYASRTSRTITGDSQTTSDDSEHFYNRQLASRHRPDSRTPPSPILATSTTSRWFGLTHILSQTTSDI